MFAGIAPIAPAGSAVIGCSTGSIGFERVISHYLGAINACCVPADASLRRTERRRGRHRLVSSLSGRCHVPALSWPQRQQRPIHTVNRDKNQSK